MFTSSLLGTEAILEGYLESLVQKQLSSKQEAAKIYCSKFFCFLDTLGIGGPGEITHQVVIEFADTVGSGIERYRNQAIFEVDHLLIYMAGIGIIAKTVGYMLNKFICGDFLAVCKLPQIEGLSKTGCESLIMIIFDNEMNIVC